MEDKRKLAEEFERGRRLGQREGFPFREGLSPLGPWLPGAKFEFKIGWFESFVEYERKVTDNLRLVQRMRWLDRKHGQETVPKTDLDRIERRIKDELSAVRRAVDAQLREGHGRACMVEAMRASPQRPSSVVEYRDLASFVGQDRRRAVGDWPHREVAAGADFGHYWQLENPFKRWETTAWRISWLLAEPAEEGDGTKEIYALEFLERGVGARSRGRVWLLGKLPSWRAVEGALQELERHAMRERNSLVVAAAAVAAAGRREEGPETQP